VTFPARERQPGLSVRIKLALSYAAFLVAAGIVLFAVSFLLLTRFVPEGAVYVAGGGWAPNRTDLLEVFVRYTWWAVGGLVVFGLVGGWLLAGVMLRPLERITGVARRARDGRLSQRVGLPGPRNELTELADALDAMLDRVQHTIDEERRFAANASHELRTPHSIIRTMVEVAQADPEGRDVDVVLQRIGTTNDRAIALTEALLMLARVGRGSALETDSVDLAAVVAECVDDERADAAARGIRIDTALAPAVVTGNRALLAQLAANLVHNAVVHNSVGQNSAVQNSAGGWVRVSVSASPAALVVANSGAVLDRSVVATLTEPFVRAAGRTRSGDGRDGAGLGLAIVASITRAHGGSLDLTALPEGGLQARVTLPR
jgi:two-component system sensor histidine kinase VanS